MAERVQILNLISLTRQRFVDRGWNITGSFNGHYQPHKSSPNTLSLLSPRKPHEDGRLAREFGYRGTDFYCPPKGRKLYFKMANGTSSFQLSGRTARRIGHLSGAHESGKSENIKGKPQSRLAAQQLENFGSMPTLLFLTDCRVVIWKRDQSWLANI